jgi:hypothetical protein
MEHSTSTADSTNKGITPVIIVVVVLFLFSGLYSLIDTSGVFKDARRHKAPEHDPSVMLPPYPAKGLDFYIDGEYNIGSVETKLAKKLAFPVRLTNLIHPLMASGIVKNRGPNGTHVNPAKYFPSTDTKTFIKGTSSLKLNEAPLNVVLVVSIDFHNERGLASLHALTEGLGRFIHANKIDTKVQIVNVTDINPWEYSFLTNQLPIHDPVESCGLTFNGCSHGYFFGFGEDSKSGYRKFYSWLRSVTPSFLKESKNARREWGNNDSADRNPMGFPVVIVTDNKGTILNSWYQGLSDGYVNLAFDDDFIEDYYMGQGVTGVNNPDILARIANTVAYHSGLDREEMIIPPFFNEQVRWQELMGTKPGLRPEEVFLIEMEAFQKRIIKELSKKGVKHDTTIGKNW